MIGNVTCIASHLVKTFATRPGLPRVFSRISATVYVLLGLIIIATASASPAFGQVASVRYASRQVDGLNIFYREAGPVNAPAIVMLHGRQTSSHMFRNLIPLLARRYHVIAPDMPGFGESATPDSTFGYTFEHIAGVMRDFIGQLGLHRYALLMQDFGVDVGFRIASAQPESVIGLVIQNGVICEPPRDPVWLDAYWANRDSAAEARLRASYELRTTKRYYQVGARNPQQIAPETWAASQFYLDLPHRRDLQADLMYDFRSNVKEYPLWQLYLGRYKPPTLILWGKDSPIFSLEHVKCYSAANPASVIRLYAGGHFMLEEYNEEAAQQIRNLLR